MKIVLAAIPIATFLKQASDLTDNMIAWLPAKTIFVELYEIVVSEKCTVTAGIIYIYIYIHKYKVSHHFIFLYKANVSLKM